MQQAPVNPEVSRVVKRRHDIVFVLLAVLSLLTLIALSSYSAEDHGWSTLADDSANNSAGRFGAYAADVLFHLFGYLAFAIPLLIMSKAVLLIWQSVPSHPVWLRRGFGLLLSIMALCVLAELSIWKAAQLPAGAGGVLGNVLADLLLPWFSLAGTAIILVATLAIGLMLFLEFSWLMVFDRIGRFIYQTVCRAWGRIGRLRQRKAAVVTASTAADEDGAGDALKATLHRTPVVRMKKSKEEPVISSSMSPLDDDIPWDDIPMLSEQPAHQLSVTPSLTVPSGSNSVKSHAAKPATAGVVSSVPPLIPIEPLQKKVSEPSERLLREQQGSLLQQNDPLPSIALLDPPRQDQKGGFSAERLQEMSRLLVQKLADFGVKIEVTAVAPGPVITRFEIQPAPGVKSSKISNLARDLARSMAMVSVRVVEVIPGKSVMGIEVPNENRAVVTLSEVLSSSDYDRSKSPLTLALGHDIAGNPVITDLAKMPHLLVAGTTGSGKSVGVNAMLASLLFKSTPEELRLILVDPKMLELSVYEGIPHLLTPVITDMKEAASGLRWSVAEMERRYQLMAAVGVRNLAGYNKKVKDAIADGQPMLDPTWQINQSYETTPKLLEPLPYIVIVIDEFADMMMMVGKKVEELIARIAQKARAAGIHMILATQRPSVDVITGLIKANVPTRIAFQVSSKIDSRTILDMGGAEQLLGHGDMLYMPPGHAIPERVHGAFVDDDEVHRLVAEWKLRGEPQYLEEITQIADESATTIGPDAGDEKDNLYDEAVAFVTESGKCSISSVQRKLRIGYNRAARLVETMEASGVVSAPAHNGSREVLARAAPSNFD